MKEAAALAVVTAAVLGLVGLAVFTLGDRETLVSPPEAIAEDFVRALATGRYDVAMQYVDPDAGISRDEIRGWSDALRSEAGGIQSVDIPEVFHDRDAAIARYAVTTTHQTQISGTLRLRFDRSWQITR